MGFFGKSINERMAELNEQLNRYNILFVSIENNPKIEIKSILTVVNGFSEYSTNKPEEFVLCEAQAKLDIFKAARKIGANGIIGAKLCSVSLAEGGSEWHKSTLYYTGTAVVI